jgi:hypothetical protein
VAVVETLALDLEESVVMVVERRVKLVRLPLHLIRPIQHLVRAVVAAHRSAVVLVAAAVRVLLSVTLARTDRVELVVAVVAVIVF